ncbi:MAG: hypothetical protein RBR78_08495 [Flavobacteriaceae bacterium]|jgi:hypothetical protein|nr:hypothetical protein [Flavobacteriaceae bacterium]
MKKLFFTAIAMIAFSSVSMANSIELEPTFTNEVNIEIYEVDEEPTLHFILTRCDAIYLKTFAVAVGEGFTTEQAGDIAYGAFRACAEIEHPEGN